jgi:hypothetical protein
MGVNMVSDKWLTSEVFEKPPSPSCCHHWIIQPALGPISEGMCQKCGEVREFKNSIDYETEWTSRKEVGRSSSEGSDNSLEDVEE